MRFIGNEEAAEDIVQEAFIKLWEKRTTYNDIPCLKTFLYVSVKNLCFNHIRNKKNTIDYTSPEVQNKEEKSILCADGSGLSRFNPFCFTLIRGRIRFK